MLRLHNDLQKLRNSIKFIIKLTDAVVQMTLWVYSHPQKSRG